MGDPSGSTDWSCSTRAGGPLITHHGAVRDTWPQLAPRLRAYLRRRGASEHDAEDIVQDCALRVLDREVPFTDTDELLRWCLTVARNAHVDLHRRQRGIPVEAVPDQAAGTDVAEEVLQRLRLQAVVESWSRLSSTDQRVLLEAVEEVPAPPVRRDAVRLYVQRNRARQRLQALTTALAGVLLVAGRALRRQLVPLTSGTAVAAAAITCLAVAPGASLAEPPLKLAPDHASAREVASVSDREATTTHAPGRPATHARAARPARSTDERLLVSAKVPGGHDATVTSHDRPSSTPTLVCVGDLPAVPDTCLADPTG